MVVIRVRFPSGRKERVRFERTFTIGTIAGSDLLLEREPSHLDIQITIAIADPDVRLDIPKRVRTLALNSWNVDADFVHVLHVGDELSLANHAMRFELVAGTAEEVRRFFGEAPREPDASEREVLAALRADPSDPSAREVYADWLDGRDRCGEAEFVRLQWLPDGKRVTDRAAFSSEWMSHQTQAIKLRLRDLGQLTDPGRRALVSRPTMYCRQRECARRWEQLRCDPDSDTTRQCGSCSEPVEFCSTFEDLTQRGLGRFPVAIDPILVAETAHRAYWEPNRELDDPTNPLIPAMDIDY